jgi:hypothetical protein
VYVGTKESPETLNRSEIKDISHPGNGATIAGGILSGYGVVNIAVGVPMCSDKGTAFCVGVFTPLALGVPILLWGIATHSSSVNAAQTPLHEHGAGVFVTPVIGVEKGQPSGAAIVGTF